MFTGNAQSPSLLASFPEWIICVLEFIAAFPTVLEGIISASSPRAYCGCAVQRCYWKVCITLYFGIAIAR